MDDFFGDRGVDPFSHHGYSLTSGMRSFAVASATRRLTIGQSCITYATNRLKTTVALLLPNPNAFKRAYRIFRS